jgi:AcrR family transcriptional regulator
LTVESNSVAAASDPARRPRDHGARPNDAQLLRGARAVFAQLGFHAATMARIADRAGCTKPTLYSHFGDKEALYRATIAHEIQVLEARLFRAYAQAESLPLHELLRSAVLVFFDYAATEPDGFALLFGDQGGGPLAQARATLIADIRTRIAELTRRYAASRGLHLTRSADLLAAMMVAVSIDGAHQSVLVSPTDPRAAGELAASFIESAVRHLDPQQLHRVDNTITPTIRSSQ